METYEQKIERVAKAMWVAFGGNADMFDHHLAMGKDAGLRYLKAARALLEEEAREVDDA